MAHKMKRHHYADMFGPTTGDKVRLGDTSLVLVDRDDDNVQRARATLVLSLSHTLEEPEHLPEPDPCPAAEPRILAQPGPARLHTPRIAWLDGGCRRWYVLLLHR